MWKSRAREFQLSLGLTIAVALASCTSTSPEESVPRAMTQSSQAGATPLNVVATTTLVGDIASRVGGDAVEVTVLLPVGADPHGFEPTPRDVATVADADMVFVNGLGLEAFLDQLLENAGSAAPIVIVSEGIETLQLSDEHADHVANGDGHGDGDGDQDERSDDDRQARGNEKGDRDDDVRVDPHVWFDPGNAAIWASNIARALTQRDPASSATYDTNVRALVLELAALDEWIYAETAAIPRERRKLVTDHDTLGYFAHRYGFEQVGTLHGFSTLAEPSAAEMARLVDDIRAQAVPAIFVGTTVRPDLAERIADETGTEVVRLFTGSLSEPGGGADTYEAFMRHNVSAIVNALSPDSPITAEP